MTWTIKIFSTLLANSILLSSLVLATNQPDEDVSSAGVTDAYDMTYKFLTEMEQRPVNEILSTASQDSFDGDIDYLIAVLLAETDDDMQSSNLYDQHQPTDTRIDDMEEDGSVPLKQPQAIYGTLPDTDFLSAIPAMASSTFEPFSELKSPDKIPTWEEGITYFAGIQPQRPAAFGHYARSARTQSQTALINDLMHFAHHDRELRAAEDPTAKEIQCSDAEMERLMQHTK